MLPHFGSEILWVFFFTVILEVIFYPQINCHKHESALPPVVEIVKVPSDASLRDDDLVAFRYSLKHDKTAPNKKLHKLPERVRDDDIQLEYSLKCPVDNKTKQERNLAQLVAVIYRKLDTSDKERTVTFYLPGPATVPVFREPITDCTSESAPKTTYVYKGCGGE
ncbi:uncharacterized protein LOC111052089 [Nilaparvata lugens]|uniref:uncharacterized protein LOC111052089 n=1 Tax=Nilaparvata lugens TaxID=108931 RepID=UPI00193CF42E|nr:uncharacterized protein LOC111052089 [Nilaparvata lugens]